MTALCAIAFLGHLGLIGWGIAKSREVRDV